MTDYRFQITDNRMEWAAHIQFFRSQRHMRRWLSAHHRNAPEVFVGFFKAGSGRDGITYRQALDEALCFGWIDGVRKKLDESMYVIRFTPRKPGSNWSAVNIKRMRFLKSRGLTKRAGIEAFRLRDERKARLHSYERRTRRLTRGYERQLRMNAKAWEFFSAQAPWYRRVAAWWVISAKKEETRRKRLSVLIDDSAHGRKLAQVTLEKRR